MITVTVYSGCPALNIHPTAAVPACRVTSMGEGLGQVGGVGRGIRGANLRPQRDRDTLQPVNSNRARHQDSCPPAHTHTVAKPKPPEGQGRGYFRTREAPLLETGAGLKHALWGVTCLPEGSRRSGLSNNKIAVGINQHSQGHPKTHKHAPN